MTQIPSGWYPDPSPQPGQPPLLRYWDGRLWTEHVHPVQPPAPQAYAGPGPTPRPTTPDGVPVSGWWRRVGAYVIDGLLVSAVSTVATIPQQVRLQGDLGDLMRRFENEVAGSQNRPDFGPFFRDYVDLLLPVITWSVLAAFVVWVVYSSLMLRFKSATLGKMAVGIAVRLRDRPGQLPWSAILVRVLVQQGVMLTAILPVLYLALSWFPYLDSLWPLWDKRNQALHDKAARTQVVLVRAVSRAGTPTGIRDARR